MEDILPRSAKPEISNIKVLVPNNRCNWYKVIVILPDCVDVVDLKKRMKETGVDLQGEVYRLPLHQQPIVNRLNINGEYRNADRVCKEHICLPIYEELTIEQAEYVVIQLKKILELICSSTNEDN